MSRDGPEPAGQSVLARSRLARRRWNAFGAKPPQAQIFELLRSGGRNLANSAELIDRLLASWPDDRGIREEITRCEH